MGYLSALELRRLRFASCGEDVRISDRCSIYGCQNVRIGSHVRIDDLTVITAASPVVIGSYVHIGAQAFIAGTHGVDIGDFVNISPGAAIFSTSDDFSGETLAGPLVTAELRGAYEAPVRIGRQAIIGARSVVLPGVTIGEGTAVGALSLVKESVPEWSIYAGVPARFIRQRSRALLALEEKFLRNHRRV